ncbi:MAG: DUF1844 domain-containing protein [Desulfohalobiaceae bacterium]|nr:DUF1844 domain-containing protein [Desulfohalobiaceae bacterium]
MVDEQKPSGTEQQPEAEPSKTERIEIKDAYQAASAEKKKKSPLPKVDFNTFVLSLSSSVMVYLGEVNDPGTGETDQDLDMARHTIDMLDMLEKKTKGNLDPDEERLLKNILFEMRMKFIQKTK